MSVITKEKEPCKHLNLQQMEDHTKVFKVKGQTREIFKTRIMTYFYCEDCKYCFDINIQDNEINKN